MNPRLRVWSIHPTAGIFLLAALLAGCDERPADTYEGYVAAHYVLISSPAAGKLESLKVRRGQDVESGAPLFVLDPRPESDLVGAADAALAAAEARLADLRQGARPRELEAFERLASAVDAARAYAAVELERAKKLYEKSVVSEENFNLNQSAQKFFLELEGAIRAWSAEIALGGRDAAIEAAVQDARAAGFELSRATWQLGQKNAFSPEPAMVFDTFFEPGEWVPAGSPVVSLLPPAGVVVRVFVPSEALPTLAPGRAVEVNSGGHTIAGIVQYVSPSAEYAPPVIYSREQSSQLVFLVEIGFEDPGQLRPGQPATVRVSSP